MPLVYTPTVGEACQKFDHSLADLRGASIYPSRPGVVWPSFLGYWPVEGCAIHRCHRRGADSGVGGLGIGGMGIPIGKLSLYTALRRRAAATDCCRSHSTSARTTRRCSTIRSTSAPLRPAFAVPEYDAFIDEFVTAVQKLYPNMLPAVGGFRQLQRRSHSGPLPREDLHL